jgi:CRP/FNR family transcriptional regulator
MEWYDDIDGLSPAAKLRLGALPRASAAKGTVLFQPGVMAHSFVVVLSGRIEVHLTGPTGREILLYAVEHGQSCIQTTLGLMADEAYSGEAVAASDAQIVLIPRALFQTLMDSEAAFRYFVMQSFARRMNDVTRLLERVAFGRIEGRLASALLELAQGGVVHATQAELAARIGSAREVITRRLDALARAGIVATDRGTVTILDAPSLKSISNVT